MIRFKKQTFLFLNYRLLTVVCGLLTMAGCATTGRIQKTGLPVESFSVNNTVYLPLISLCRHFNILWEYDYIGRQVTLRKANVEAKLFLDTSVVLVNGLPLDIEYPVITHNGFTAVPLKFKEKVIDKFYLEAVPEEKPKYILEKRIKKVVIDAGHGGHDPGAIGKTGLREKDVNLDIARRLAQFLKAQGIEVLMTRSTDKFISLQGRADIANRSRADLFISVHSNSAASGKLNGFEVYYITEKVNDYSRALFSAKSADLDIDSSSFYGSSLDLKTTLWDMVYTSSRLESIRLAQNICESAERNMGLKILGVKGAPFYVLKGAHIPAVLIETGFLSNPKEEKYLRNNFYRQQIAEAISDGIIHYSRQYELAGAQY